MSENFDAATGMPADDMAEYVQMFVDETSENLDDLVETLLVLESDPASQPHLNEVFRLVHSIKGSAMLLGLDSISVLTHHMENHFARLRSGSEVLDQPMMDLVLECIDFLRDCVTRLRAGQPLASVPELLERLAAISEQQHLAETTGSGGSARNAANAAHKPAVQPVAKAAPESPQVESLPSTPAANYTLGPLNYDDDDDEAEELDVETVAAGDEPPAAPSSASTAHEPPRRLRVTVHFQKDVELPGLRAELVLSRLSEIGEVRRTIPDATELQRVEVLGSLQVLIETFSSDAQLRIGRAHV